MAKQNTEDLEELAKETPRLERLKVKQIGELSFLARRVLRTGQAMVHCGEPAGFLYYFQGKEFDDRIRKYAKNNWTGDSQQAAKQYKDKSARSRSRSLTKTSQFLNDGDLEKAEAEMEKLWKDVHLYDLFLRPSDLKALYDEIRSLDRQLTDALRADRVAKARAAILAATNSDPADIGTLLNQATAAVADVRGSGTTQQFGESLTGPEALKQMVKRWQAIHEALMRATGREWIEAGLESICENTDGENFYTQSSAVSQIETLNEKLPAAMAQLIEADLQRAGESDLPGIYQAYLGLVIELHALADDTAVLPLQRALDQAATLDNAFGKRLREHLAATAELVRWQQRTTLQSAAKLVGSGTSLAEVKAPNRIHQSLHTTQDELAEVFPDNGIMTAGARNVGGLHFSSLPAGTRQLLVIEGEVTPSAADYGAGLPEEFPQTTELALLATTVEQVRFQRFGGKPIAVQALPFATQLAQASDNKGLSLVPLGTLPARGAIHSLLVRFCIELEWGWDGYRSFQ